MSEEIFLRRREWIQLALSPLGAWLGAARAKSPSFEKDPFSLGVASGSPTHNSIVLWTRLLSFNPMRNPWSEIPIAVRWELSTQQDFAVVQHSGEVVALPQLAHSVHVEPEGLQSNQTYFYRFKVGAYQSPTGKTRTAPAKGTRVDALKFAVASCQRYHSGAFTAYAHMLRDDPELVLFLGDYIYEMGAKVGEPRGSWAYAARTLNDYRTLYELAKSDAHLQAMHAACPWLTIWDDHEVLNDYAGGAVRAGETGRTARHMGWGYQAWYEHMPVPAKVLTQGVKGLTELGAELRIYGTYEWGDLARFYLFDMRQYRSAHVDCGIAKGFKPDECSDWKNPQRSMLGANQERWLDAQLQTSTAFKWSLLAQTTVMSHYRLPVLGGLAWSDCWDGYPVSRERLMNSLQANQTPNPIVFGGDIHQNWVSHVKQGQYRVPEFVMTSLTTRSLGSATAQEMKALSPDCLYTDRHRRGYGLVNLKADAMQINLRSMEDVVKSDSPIETRNRFEVKAGSSYIHELPSL
jgi:alkaline phosphatase D